MFSSKFPKVNISIPKKALDGIFDECDKFDVDETGGRIVGTYERKGKAYDVNVLGVIPAGPKARRSPTSFFQDGEYQEGVFRLLEREYPNLEHLGNWHTHHVNGLSTLSSGDRTTYRNVVNHEKHNTDFFYALLVVRKTSDRDQRYEVKHFLVFRNVDGVYEIPKSQIHILERSACISGENVENLFSRSRLGEKEVAPDANLERVRDQEFFAEFFPDLKPGFSKTLGTLYWKGEFRLIDGTQARVLAMESANGGRPSYSVALAGYERTLDDLVESYKTRNFGSARAGVLYLERDVNQELYRRRKE